MKKDLKLKFNHKNHNVEINPRINPTSKFWFAEYLITREYPEGIRTMGFSGKKEFPNKEQCLTYYKKLAIFDIENN